jgi:predicted nucleic acid-binding protein
MAAPLVLIDTCVWAPFFSRGASRHKTAVEQLLDEDRAALVGPIFAEILLGFKKDTEADWVASALEGVHLIELTWDDWRAAAQLGRRLAARGHRLPLSDLILAAVARRRKCLVYSIDPHFDVIEGLDRFPPA